MLNEVPTETEVVLTRGEFCPAALRVALAKRIDRCGLTHMSKSLGLSKSALLSVLADRKVHLGTIAVLRERLAPETAP